MACNTQTYRISGLCPSYGSLKEQEKKPFRKLELCPSSNEWREISTLLRVASSQHVQFPKHYVSPLFRIPEYGQSSQPH
jgi:hypothetical protein